MQGGLGEERPGEHRREGEVNDGQIFGTKATDEMTGVSANE